ncbi:preprotein translocase subunit SecE [Idiomarina tyrosinivorans]|uniref:Protein translocase subunit SecE n=1 Tax=Idiomarina tyrosinivorans TaxID=1445662 RepID=A0A432ZQI8_9GAMM|nr:preprotein translocase subunit SecE [Idiomarina tyrosinivorans]RUO80174.1 preprotein translocase subunit SecE [Idiomarina tyrosinivorans]
MSANTETRSSSLDWFKWILVIILLAAAVGGNHYYAEQYSVLVRAVGVVVLVGIAAFLAAFTGKGQKFLSFAKESRTEVRKVVWPTRQESTQTTLIVVVATVIMSLILWGLDAVLVRIVGFITGLEF